MKESNILRSFLGVTEDRVGSKTRPANMVPARASNSLSLVSQTLSDSSNSDTLVNTANPLALLGSGGGGGFAALAEPLLPMESAASEQCDAQLAEFDWAFRSGRDGNKCAVLRARVVLL